MAIQGVSRFYGLDWHTVKAIDKTRLRESLSEPDWLNLSTMHLAKGLEFKAFAVMGCDDEVIPLQSRLESASDQSALETIYNTERHLLYVA
jgi:superfamily I DNA/RNA helicase